MYIDIHTHKSAAADVNEVRVCSVYKDLDAVHAGGYYSAGVHPCHLQGYARDLELLKTVALRADVLAIGECGLDKICGDYELQRIVFRQQILLANSCGKPLVIHCVRAFDEVIAVLDEADVKVPVVMHGYNKKMAVAQRLLDKGYYLSFGAAILNDSMPAADVLRQVPADRYFLETDDADVAIAQIYDKAAALRATAVENIILQVAQNFKSVFRK